MTDIQTEEDRVNVIWARRVKLFEAFNQLYRSYDEGVEDLASLVDAYHGSIPEVQGIINYVMTALCGYCIPTIEKAMDCNPPEDVEADYDQPFTFPEKVQSIVKV